MLYNYIAIFTNYIAITTKPISVQFTSQFSNKLLIYSYKKNCNQTFVYSSLK